jgi:hypothetical protein
MPGGISVGRGHGNTARRVLAKSLRLVARIGLAIHAGKTLKWLNARKEKRMTEATRR